jgi:L-ascorbate metabolism protein UlaG (beta-lactamase superfamily)
LAGDTAGKIKLKNAWARAFFGFQKGETKGERKKTMRTAVTYLDNSGFAVQMNQDWLIFDDWLTTPERGKKGLAGGVITPQDLKKAENVFVLVSHRHADHFNPEVLQWKQQIAGIHYILSDDIPPHEGATMVSPNKEYQVGDLFIKTYHSTDEGVAFLIQKDGFTIYHAGDLHWWHWEGEDPAWNRQMEQDYRREIEKISRENIDLAFIPVDPRLGDACIWGAREFLQTVLVKVAIPMHYRNAGKAAAAAIETLPPDLRKKIILPMKRGETLEWEWK